MGDNVNFELDLDDDFGLTFPSAGGRVCCGAVWAGNWKRSTPVGMVGSVESERSTQAGESPGRVVGEFPYLLYLLLLLLLLRMEPTLDYIAKQGFVTRCTRLCVVSMRRCAACIKAEAKR